MSEFDEMWAAVLRRDSGSDGQFVFGVTSTSIYCRPSCPARRPLKKNVAFFDSPTNAEIAGFRACLRCHPNGKGLEEQHLELVNAARELIENAEQTPTLGELATTVGVSAYHLHRIFKKHMSVTPKQYAQAVRTKKLRTNLRAAKSVTEAIYDSGYGSSSRAYESLSETLGMTPGAYKNGGKNLALIYAVRQTSMGYVLVAATKRGICWIELGDAASSLRQRLSDEFPNATLVGDESELDSALDQITAFLENPAAKLDLPVDLCGTEFQQTVWRALQEIPLGETASYLSIAQAIGKPKAHRAVASACANNKVALVVPCHRVIRSNGEMGGYRWGVQRKEALLEKEKIEKEKREKEKKARPRHNGKRTKGRG